MNVRALPRPLDWSLPRLAALTPVLVVAGFVLVEIPTLGQPLLEVHPWRQTHTAWTARIFVEQGIDLLHPVLPVFGPPWVVPFEFPLYQAVGAVVAFVLPLDNALRLVNLIAFGGTALLLYDLLRRTASGAAAVVGMGAFLLTPLALVWSRTSMIEYTATLGAVGFLWAGTRWLDDGGRRWWWAALGIGMAGVLVKITTGAFYLLPLLAYRGGWRRPATWALVIALLLVGAAWLLYGDAIKATHPVAWQFTSTAMADRYGGSSVDRLDLVTWAPIALRASLYVMGLAVPVWLALGWTGGNQFWRVVLLMAPLSVVVLVQQYWENDYYLAAISPILAASVGLGGSWLWSRRSMLRTRGAMILLAGAWALAMVGAAPYWTQPWAGTIDRQWDLPAARYIREHSEPGDLVLVRDRYWDPAALYYANRWGLMPAGVTADRDAYDLEVSCPMREPCQTLVR